MFLELFKVHIQKIFCTPFGNVEKIYFKMSCSILGKVPETPKHLLVLYRRFQNSLEYSNIIGAFWKIPKTIFSRNKCVKKAHNANLAAIFLRKPVDPTIN